MSTQLATEDQQGQLQPLLRGRAFPVLRDSRTSAGKVSQDSVSERCLRSNISSALFITGACRTNLTYTWEEVCTSVCLHAIGMRCDSVRVQGGKPAGLGTGQGEAQLQGAVVTDDLLDPGGEAPVAPVDLPGRSRLSPRSHGSDRDRRVG